MAVPPCFAKHFALTLYDEKMLAEWSVECATEDPVLVVPWADSDGLVEFVDLRADPYDLHRIPEAEEHPPLMQALRALNATRSPVFTAKCDAWTMDEEEVEHLRLHLEADFDGSEDSAMDLIPLAFGFISYIDLVWHERAVFVSFHQQEQIVQRLVRHAAGMGHPYAALECVLRPALIDLDGPQEGYAVSFYVKALGADAASALKEWGNTLTAVVALVRSKELQGTAKGRPQSGHGRSITID